jgi:hypothetical protein
MKLEINKPYRISELIEIVKSKFDRDFDGNGKEKYISENLYDIYIAENQDLNEETVLFVGETVKIDDEDNEIYPDEVLEKKFEMFFSCQNFQDIIDLAYSQKSNASISDYIKCLKYYAENDTFLDIEQ